MLIAQISDPHVAGRGETALDGTDTAACLMRAVRHLNRLAPRPDLVVATGDLAADGKVAEYALAREILAPLEMPLFVIPGNHDDRERLRRAFADHSYLPRAGRFLHYAVDDFPVRLIALDTIVPGENRGELCPERLAWLEARLAEAPDRPTVIVMHHPPFVNGIARLDAQRCAPADALGATIARHPCIERMLCGHIHRPIQVRWFGTIAATCPSVARQMELSLDPDIPFGWSDEPPALYLHIWRDGDGMVTHTSVIDGR